MQLKKKGAAKNKQDLKGVGECLKGKAEGIAKRRRHNGRMNGRKTEEGKAEWVRKWSRRRLWFFFVKHGS